MLLPSHAASAPQVDGLKQEIAEARGCGTPHGEAAKKVSRLALERVRDLQNQVGGWGCGPAGAVKCVVDYNA